MRAHEALAITMKNASPDGLKPIFDKVKLAAEKGELHIMLDNDLTDAEADLLQDWGYRIKGMRLGWAVHER